MAATPVLVFNQIVHISRQHWSTFDHCNIAYNHWPVFNWFIYNVIYHTEQLHHIFQVQYTGQTEYMLSDRHQGMLCELTDWIKFMSHIGMVSAVWYIHYMDISIIWTWDRLFVAPTPEAQNRWHSQEPKQLEWNLTLYTVLTSKLLRMCQ